MDTQIKCYCISLKENIHERLRCQEIFDRLNLKVDFEIVERSSKGGKHGCFTSHIKVLNKGLETGNEYIMIMEEDIYFDYLDPEIFTKIFKFIETCDKNIKWCLCLGYFTASKSTTVTDDIVTLNKCYCSHAYIVPRQTAEKLIEMEWKEIPYDIQWHEVIEIFYAPYPMIAFQKDHYSSISGDFGAFLINTIGFKNIARLCEFWSSM